MKQVLVRYYKWRVQFFQNTYFIVKSLAWFFTYLDLLSVKTFDCKVALVVGNYFKNLSKRAFSNLSKHCCNLIKPIDRIKEANYSQKSLEQLATFNNSQNCDVLLGKSYCESIIIVYGLSFDDSNPKFRVETKKFFLTTSGKFLHSQINTFISYKPV